MACVTYALRTPESIRVLLAEFGFAILFTYAWWRSGLPMRGISRKDGPLPKAAKWIIALFTLGFFLLLATISAVQRRQMGLPVF
jgi:hypothetical protein